MPPIDDHPLRYALANELHARPFPVLSSPGQAAFLAIKHPVDAAKRDRALDRAHLIALLDRHGAPHPPEDATHYTGQIGKCHLKWEQHTEFVTYSAFLDGQAERAFDPEIWEVFPEDWLAAAPGARITSAHIHIANAPKSEAEIAKQIDRWFLPESLAVSQVLDAAAVIAGDFRITPQGHMNFALFVDPKTGPRRIGRVVQRICEIETYKAMSMLGLPRARAISTRMGAMDRDLAALLDDMAGDLAEPDATLGKLLTIAADLENQMARASFRFGATRAYEALVHQRIEVLRETRFQGRQTFAEFMMRRFDPTMRTVQATESRLQQMTERAYRAGDLLRTRVDVDRSAQNQALLESMDKRAALQLRLQKTVEGLSVVAISYYAVNLMVYLTTPLAEQAGISKTILASLLALPVIAAVWLIVRAIRRKVD